MRYETKDSTLKPLLLGGKPNTNPTEVCVVIGHGDISVSVGPWTKHWHRNSRGEERYVTEDLILKSLLADEPDETDVTLSVDDTEVSLSIGPSDWTWDRKTGRLTDSGACVAPRPGDKPTRNLPVLLVQAAYKFRDTTPQLEHQIHIHVIKHPARGIVNPYCPFCAQDGVEVCLES